MTQTPSFFFGANTPQGFGGFHKTDLYDPRDGWAAFLIKSGAGTGKATFMREILKEATARGLETVVYPCSSDPDSLDAVVLPRQKLCVIDATAPHVIEPTAYGECEQLVPFGCCLRAEQTLAQADAWFDAADACAAAHARCCRFLASAAGLLDNNAMLATKGMYTDKVTALAARLVTRECGRAGEEKGCVTRCFFAVVTPKGIRHCFESAAALCPKLYVLQDEYGAVAPLFMRTIVEGATAAGQNVIEGFDAWHPHTATHVLIPSLGVGFLTADSRHPLEEPVYRRIHAARFVPSEALVEKRQQMRFNRRAANELLEEAVRASAEAKSHHDRMEALHIAAMDWDLWRDIADRAAENFWRIADGRTKESE